MPAKPSLGQHFLKDQNYLKSIVESADLNMSDTVLEIGPGEGDLTTLLSAKVTHVSAVELDEKLINPLEKRFVGSNVEIIHADFRDFELNSMGEGYKVVANIPYYISGEIIKTLLMAKNKPKKIVLLVQKEVAQRVVAPPGKLSVLGISAQLLADVKLGIEVPAEAFTPPPQIDSQVLILFPLSEPRINVDVDKFMRLVKLAFSQKRKKLSNSLAPNENAKKAAAVLDLSDKRAQELTFDDWQKLYNRTYA